MSDSLIHVKIAEVKLGRAPEKLKTTLGSCVGIAFIWRSKQLCGLAHCLLPASNMGTYQIGAKFVDQAIYSLIKLMKICKEDLQEIEVYLAGGSNVVDTLSNKSKEHIGNLNSKAAILLLNEKGFKVKCQSNLGGNKAKQMFVDCSTFDVNVKEISDCHENANRSIYENE